MIIDIVRFRLEVLQLWRLDLISGLLRSRVGNFASGGAGIQNLKILLSDDQRSVDPVFNNAHLTRKEATLDCAACHATKDHHFGLFDNDCAMCHGTSSWMIAEFDHPPPSSSSCVQCHHWLHPSHYMEHFKMISQRVARQPDARLDQCYKCHQTTSWNDIQAVGFYKHH